MSALTAEGLSYAVPTATLISDVKFEASGGEVVAVIGPNGAGKTTLLNLLAGEIEPTAGAVTIGGHDVASMDGTDLALVRAFLGQGRTAGIPFTVAEVVALGGWRRDMASEEMELALEAMDLVGLRDRVVGSLSSGEHTRVELARILLQDTPLILLDEPLSALDVAHQERVMRHLRSVAAGGRAVVVVLHDLNVAAVHADRVVLMADGEVVSEGAPAEVMNPATLSALYGHDMIVAQAGTRMVIVPAAD